jgi:hypothetical protein
MGAAALLVLCGAGPAAAQDGIFNVVINLSSLGSNSPNDTEVSTDFEIGSDAGAGPIQGFTSRYGFNVNADSKSVSRSKMASAVHQVSFEVHSARGYSLLISTGWVGQMLRRADTLECADAVVLSGVTGEVIGGFGLSSGSLSLSDPPDITLLDAGDATVELSEVADAVIRVARAEAVEFHTLRFSWNAGVLSNTCEAAVRLGGSSGTTTECLTCAYPGDPVRDQQFDGHFVNVQFVPSNCGNGELDSDEECDLGAGNGFGACCDVFCKREPDEMPCGDNLFCNGDGRCASGVCVELGDPCAAASGCSVCDEANDQCVPCTATPTDTPTTTATEAPTDTATPTGSATPSASASASATATGGAATPTGSATPIATPSATATGGAATPTGSATSIASATATVTAAGTATPTTPGAAGCSCDCDGDGRVGINELVQAVSLALGNAGLSSCMAADPDRDGMVGVNELVQGVNAALSGCV